MTSVQSQNRFDEHNTDFLWGHVESKNTSEAMLAKSDNYELYLRVFKYSLNSQQQNLVLPSDKLYLKLDEIDKIAKKSEPDLRCICHSLKPSKDDLKVMIIFLRIKPPHSEPPKLTRSSDPSNDLKRFQDSNDETIQYTKGFLLTLLNGSDYNHVSRLQEFTSNCNKKGGILYCEFTTHTPKESKHPVEFVFSPYGFTSNAVQKCVDRSPTGLHYLQTVSKFDSKGTLKILRVYLRIYPLPNTDKSSDTSDVVVSPPNPFSSSRILPAPVPYSTTPIIYSHLIPSRRTIG